MDPATSAPVGAERDFDLVANGLRSEAESSSILVADEDASTSAQSTTDSACRCHRGKSFEERRDCTGIRRAAIKTPTTSGATSRSLIDYETTRSRRCMDSSGSWRSSRPIARILPVRSRDLWAFMKRRAGVAVCRARHKRHYTARRIMPSVVVRLAEFGRDRRAHNLARAA